MKIAVVNKSTALDAYGADLIARALYGQTKAGTPWAWAYNSWPTDVQVLPTPPSSWWPMYLFDDADQAGALGYHDVKTPGGQPLMKVFVKTSQADGVEVSTVASHELLETLADPNIDRVVVASSTRMYAYEVGDPVEQFSYGVTVLDINGATQIVQVSDWVKPAWFSRGSTGPWDHLGRATAPLTIAPGGSYIGVFICGVGWTTINAHGDTKKPKPHSRMGARADRGR